MLHSETMMTPGLYGLDCARDTHVAMMESKSLTARGG